MAVHYRQGDVLLLAVRRFPAGAEPVPREGGRVVLAHGEATGHSHAIAEPHPQLYADPDGITDLYLEIAGSGAVLTHEEHDPIPLSAGRYRVVRQREYTGGFLARDVVD
jgi:hypothetical protein